MGTSTVEKYDEDALPAFVPPEWSLKEIRAAIPPELFVRDTRRGLFYFARDVTMAAVVGTLATFIDPYFKDAATKELLTPIGAKVARWAAWCLYWYLQGLIFTGLLVIGHECGHESLCNHKIVNKIVGFIAHSFVLCPFWSFKVSHHNHHFHNSSMERDEVYVPRTRKDFNIPDKPNEQIHWDEIYGDTPIYTLFKVIRQQLLGFTAYFLFNVGGQKDYPKWTSHFNPNSVLFTKDQRNGVTLSVIGVAAMLCGIIYASFVYGVTTVFKYYVIPWLEVSNWFVMFTYLQHTDPLVPHYRGKGWTFQRGAIAAVDRDFLGWQGTFFLHNIAHYHVVHHFFPKMPFYHTAEATQHLKVVLGDYYLYCDQNIFVKLWDNFSNTCQFVEDEGDVVFYRNRKGQALLRPADPYRVKLKGQ